MNERDLTINYIETGERIRELRKEAGLTVEKLAEKIGVGVRVVYKWQSGEIVPKVEHLYALSVLFRVSIEYILTGRHPWEFGYTG